MNSRHSSRLILFGVISLKASSLALERVLVRGEMHLSILIENMRREGYEFQVSTPRVMYKEIDGVIKEYAVHYALAFGRSQKLRLITEKPACGNYKFKAGAGALCW